MEMGDRGGLPGGKDPPRYGRSPGANADCRRASAHLRRRLLRAAAPGSTSGRAQKQRTATPKVEKKRASDALLNSSIDQPRKGGTVGQSHGGQFRRLRWRN